MNVDFHCRHSLSAGGPGSLLGALWRLWGLPLDALFPQESRTFRYNQLCLKIQMEPLLSVAHGFKIIHGFHI